MYALLPRTTRQLSEKVKYIYGGVTAPINAFNNLNQEITISCDYYTPLALICQYIFQKILQDFPQGRNLRVLEQLYLCLRSVAG